jgi:hypothetical protein
MRKHLPLLLHLWPLFFLELTKREGDKVDFILLARLYHSAARPDGNLRSTAFALIDTGQVLGKLCPIFGAFLFPVESLSS